MRNQVVLPAGVVTLAGLTHVIPSGKSGNHMFVLKATCVSVLLQDDAQLGEFEKTSLHSKDNFDNRIITFQVSCQNSLFHGQLSNGESEE